MKSRIAAIGPVVPAVGAVGASIALSLLILQSPPLTLVPGTAPADRGHAGALILPALHVPPPAASTQPQVLRPAPAKISRVVARPKASRPAAPSRTRTRRPSTPQAQTTPPPATPTPPTVPTVPTVATTAASTNNGRWSSPATKTWKAGAAKQNERTAKGKPPWAGSNKDTPKKGTPATATTTTPTAPAASAPDTSNTPPGQAKTPPGQAKKG